MIGSIRDRSTFVALRARGIRARSGVLSATYLPEADGDGTRVAYAITKRVGGAVERNRLRRRLRAILAELARDPAGPVPSGALVLSAGPEAARRSPDELRIDVERLLTVLAERRATGEAR